MNSIKTILNSEQGRSVLLLRVIAVLWFVTKVFSYKTWIADRKYPVVAPADFLQKVPSEIHLALFGIAMLMLFAIVISPKKYFLVLFLIFEFLSCSLDTVRWQPWEFMYICIFALYFLHFRKKKTFFRLLHFFLVSVYIFSGLHKLNRGFLENVWLRMVLENLFNLSQETIVGYKLFFLGLIIPFTEIFAGIVLLFSRRKKYVSYCLISVHIIVLFFIGPFGLNYNPVIWSWNLAMIFMLILVYLKPFESFSLTLLKRNAFWFLLWFVMPVFSFFGMWYQYFSSSLYTGKEKQLYIYVSKENEEYRDFSVPDHVQSYHKYYIINLQNWAMKEIKSAPLPEDDIYRKISVILKDRLGKDCGKIILYDPHTKKQTEL